MVTLTSIGADLSLDPCKQLESNQNTVIDASACVVAIVADIVVVAL